MYITENGSPCYFAPSLDKTVLWFLEMKFKKSPEYIVYIGPIYKELILFFIYQTLLAPWILPWCQWLKLKKRY